MMTMTIEPVSAFSSLDVLVESWPAEKAVEEAHKKVATIYARYQGG